MSNLSDEARIAELREGMTPKQFKLAEAILSGSTPTEAQKIAGYKTLSNSSEARSKPNVAEYISLCRKKESANAVMSRQDVLKQLAEIAKGEHSEDGKKDATGRTGAMREISRISGFYEPEKHEMVGTIVDRIRNGQS